MKDVGIHLGEIASLWIAANNIEKKWGKHHAHMLIVA